MRSLAPNLKFCLPRLLRGCRLISRHAKRLLLHEQILEDEQLLLFGKGRSISTEQDSATKQELEGIVGLNARALACAAADAIGCSSVPSIKFFDTGSWNRIFLLSFAGGPQVVARIPYRKCGGRSRIASEVATMTFARYHCHIPCPRVLAWNSSETNPVGTPYILMEKVDGTPPFAVWQKESEDRRLKILDNLAKFHARFAHPLPFSHIGSLHFADIVAENCESLSLDDPALYRVGPFLPRPNPNIPPDQQVIPLAPSTSLADFWRDYLSREHAAALARWGSARDAVIVKAGDEKFLLEDRDYTMGEFLDAVSYLQAIIRHYELPSDHQLLAPCLVTTDYAFRNILIDPDTLEVMTFLDWDDVSLMPFILCTRFPEDIAWSYGAPPNSVWARTGRFIFVPNDEPPLPGEEYEREMERQKYRAYYKKRLSAYDGRFSPKLWETRGDALKIQNVVTRGWVGYLSRLDWLLDARKDIDALDVKRGGRITG